MYRIGRFYERYRILGKKFKNCKYSDKLIGKLLFLNTQVKKPVDIREVKKVFTMLVNIMVSKCVNQVILIILIQLQ